jgi:hypothetical protein
MQYNDGFCCIFELCASERVEFATIPSTREPVGAFRRVRSKTMQVLVSYTLMTGGGPVI